jgi:hypothetical protein
MHPDTRKNAARRYRLVYATLIGTRARRAGTLGSKLTSAPPQTKTPIEKFMVGRISDFTKQCKRLRDKGPLTEYKALIDAFQFVVFKLGTLEHEVALAKLDSDFQYASKESSDAWREIWRDFREHRRKAREADEFSAESHKREAELVAELENAYLEMGMEHRELRESFRDALDAAKAGMSIDIGMGRTWRRSSWLFLLINLYAFTANLRYFVAKVSFFIFRHTFIFATSIIFLGLIYSETSRLGIATITTLYPQWPWLGLALTLFGYFAKKYYFDPKFRKWQIKLESRRLRRLSFQLHIVRTLALYSRTLSREPAPITV